MGNAYGTTECDIFRLNTPAGSHSHRYNSTTVSGISNVSTALTSWQLHGGFNFTLLSKYWTVYARSEESEQSDQNAYDTASEGL